MVCFDESIQCVFFLKVVDIIHVQIHITEQIFVVFKVILRIFIVGIIFVVRKIGTSSCIQKRQ